MSPVDLSLRRFCPPQTLQECRGTSLLTTFVPGAPRTCRGWSPSRHAGDTRHNVFSVEVLNIDGVIRNSRAGFPDSQSVLRSLSGHVRVRQLINENRGVALDDGLDIHLFESHAAILEAAERDTRKVPTLSVSARDGFDECDTRSRPVFQQVALLPAPEFLRRARRRPRCRHEACNFALREFGEKRSGEPAIPALIFRTYLPDRPIWASV